MNNEKLKIKAELAASIFHDIPKNGVQDDEKMVERVTYLTNRIIDGIDTGENHEYNLDVMKRLQQAVIRNISNPMSYGLPANDSLITKLFEESMKIIK